MQRNLIPQIALRSGLALVSLSLVISAAFLGGCGSGSGTGSGTGGKVGGGLLGSGEGDNGVVRFVGPLTARIVGAARPAVFSGGAGVTVSGLTGASFTELLHDRTPIVYSKNDLLYTVPVSGGERTQLPTPSPADSPSYPAWSRDGKWIAFAANGVLFKMALDGSKPIPLNDRASFGPIAWSPDGSKIAYFAADSSTLCTVSTAGNETGNNFPDPTTIATGGGFCPTWSPDGARIAYTGLDGSVSTVSSSGGTPISLTSGSDPAWSPDGSQIAYTDRGLIYTIPARGGNRTQITTGTPSNPRLPRWSPDSSRIVYSTSYDSDRQGQVFVVSASGGPSIQLTMPDDSVYSAFGPDWYPTPGDKQLTRLLGRNGLLGTGAAGILYSQSGTTLTVLAFDTTGDPQTRPAAVITPQNIGSTDLLIFTIFGDANQRQDLSTVAYVVLDSVSGIQSVVSTPTLSAGTKGAIVTFSARTGAIVSVLPFGSSRAVGGSKPSATLQGSTLVLKGHFLGGFDGAGTNRAANGASEVRLDAKSGELISFE